MAIYHVTVQTNDQTTELLVKAGTKAQAIRHVTKAIIEAEAVTVDEMADLFARGLKVESAAPEKEDTPASSP